MLLRVFFAIFVNHFVHNVSATVSYGRKELLDIRTAITHLGLDKDFFNKGEHSRELPSDTSLLDELNHFYAHFEETNTEACMRASAVLDDCVITLSVADVSKTFKHSQSQWASWVTRTCAPGMCWPTGRCLH